MQAAENPAPNRPRALILLPATFADGGIQRFNRTFLSACDLISIDCEVLSLVDTETARSQWTAPASVHIRVFNHDRMRFAAAAGYALLRGNYQFVVIGHANLLELVAVGALLRPGSGPRVFFIAHGIEVWTGMSSWRRRRSMRAVDLTLSVSRYTQDRIRQQVPDLPDNRFTLFPNALSETWASRFGGNGSHNADEPMPERFLLSVTRLDRGDRYKGVICVLEALAMLADKSIHYVIAGQGNDQSFLQSVAARCGLSERVHFLGAVSDAQLVALYRQCATFILPSGKEGFGIVFLESMFFGAPVIAAHEKGAIDVVRHEQTGLTVAYGDTMGLKQAIERVTEDSTLREKLRAAGRAAVTGDGPFTFRAFVARLAAVFGCPTPSHGESSVVG
jgi:glycosyltransferase involved in cell wall biosynthesis